ncbi:MAG: hypothetical protein R2712_12505 [Vicinamibacterales bacterium]
MTRALAAALAAAAVACTPAAPARTSMTYPQTARGDVVEDYHGTEVPDPYRWMEDLDAPAVADWVAAENAVTEPYLAKLPLRERLTGRLTELWNYARVGLPATEGGKIFYAKNAGLQRQSPIYVRDNWAAAPRLVIDPNDISADGSVSLAQWTVSPDARRLAYGLAEGGADWRTIKVRDLASGTDLDDEVRWMRFSGISWTRDSRGFFYSRYPEPPANKVLEAALSGQALYYHRVGRPQSEDVLVYERPDLPGWLIGGSVTEDGRYLLIVMAEGSGNQNRLYYADLGSARSPNVKASVKPLVETDDAEYAPIGNVGPLVYLRSDKDAPNRKVIAIDALARPPNGRRSCPSGQRRFESVGLIGGRIVAHLVDVQSRLQLDGLDGTDQGTVRCPAWGPWSGINGPRGRAGNLHAFSALLTPSTVFLYDPSAVQSTASNPPALPVDLSGLRDDGDETHPKDGTRVPHFMTARKNSPRDGSNPTMAYGAWRLLHFDDAGLSPGRARLARAGRRLGHGQHAGRRRVRRGVAPGGDAGPEAARVR